MFDLSRVGKQIKKYRINADMTQMELAERMGVSFQAVSSWERSETMPDISRLVELGEIFRVSVDEILDHQEKTSTVKRLINPQDEEISIKELEELEGIIKPSDISKYKLKIGSMEEIEYIITFVGRDMATELVKSNKDLINSIYDMNAIAPFISRELMDNIVCENLSKIKDIQELLYLVSFTGRETADKAALQFEKADLTMEQIVSLAPFISRETVDKMVLSSGLHAECLQDIFPLLPFISNDIIKEILG